MTDTYTPTPTAAPSAPTPAPAPKPAKTASRPRRAPRRRGDDKALIRQAVETSQELAGLEVSDLNLLGALLACDPTVVEVTVAVVSAGRAEKAVIEDVQNLIEGDATGRAITFLTMEPARRRQVWAIFHALDLVSVKAMPQVDAKAATSIAEVEVPWDVVSRVDRVFEIVKG